MNLRIFVKSFLTAAAVIFGAVMFPGDVSAAEKEDVFRKTDWDENEQYIILSVSFINPEDKVTFIGCDTRENYDKYMQALRDNASDAVLAGLRSNNKCLVLKNTDWYFIQVTEMDEKTGRITQVMRDYQGITDGPFFTDITLDKRFVRHLPYDEKGEEAQKNKSEKFLAKWNKPFTLKRSKFFCNSMYDYRKPKYDWRATDANLLLIEERYELEGKCFWIEKGTILSIVSRNRYQDIEYKVLSGPHEGKVVAADALFYATP